MCGPERGTRLIVLFILLPAVMAMSLLIHRRGEPNSKNTPEVSFSPVTSLVSSNQSIHIGAEAWSWPHSDQGGPEVGPSEPGPLPFP